MKACFMKKTLGFIANKWALLVILSISRGNQSFNDIKKDLEDITPKMLSARLQELSQENIIQKTILQEEPLRTRYTLTKSGEELIKITNQLKSWGLKHTNTQGTCKAKNCRHYPEELTKITPQHS